jgi:hypothetical protein
MKRPTPGILGGKIIRKKFAVNGFWPIFALPKIGLFLPICERRSDSVAQLVPHIQRIALNLRSIGYNIHQRIRVPIRVPCLFDTFIGTRIV